MKKPISNSKSNRLIAEKRGTSEFGGFIYPLGLLTGVPEIIIELALPW